MPCMRNSLIILLLLTVPCYGATYYVKDGGSDGADGLSWANAWATLGKVNTSGSGGDTVYFGTGRYRGYLDVKGGTAADPTCYACSAFTYGIAEIWGSDSIDPSDWIQHSGNVYKVPIGYQTGCYGGENGNYDRMWAVGQISTGVDTLLACELSLEAVNAAGEQYYDYTNDTLYVWAVGGGNPSSYDIEASMRTIAKFDNSEDYVTIWGFKMRYSQVGGVYFDNAGADSGNYNKIEHLHVTRVASGNGTNTECIGGNSAGDLPYDDHFKYAEIRACSVGYVVEWAAAGGYGDNDHAYGIGYYTLSYSIIESCVVIEGGMHPYVGICFKGGGIGSAIRHNIIIKPRKTAISLGCAHNRDSVYGNIIIGDGTENGCRYPLMVGNCTWGYNPYICNNTIYMGKYAGIMVGADAALAHPDSIGTVKYNVIHTVTTPSGGYAGVNSCYRNDSASWIIDSNMYYVDEGDSIFTNNASSRNWTTWKSAGFDASGSLGTDPGFDSTGAVDKRQGFKRSGASQEMEVTYGGRIWYNFGAVQNTYNGAPTIKLKIEGAHLKGVYIR